MANIRDIFHHFFSTRNYPPYVNENFIYDAFEEILYNVTERLENKYGEIPNPHMILDYIIEEYVYIFSSISEENQNKLVLDPQFKKNFILSLSDKIYFNEFLAFRAKSTVSKYYPPITALRFYLNFILEQFTTNKARNEYESLMIDILRKAFLSCLGVTTFLVQGFETEAFSSWRTIHEIECIAKILFEYPSVYNTYLKHIEYNRAFRNQYSDKEEQQRVIDEIKGHLKDHNLKSKDLKKYIEYGWIYAISGIENKYPNLKLNFRNGIETIANLSSYSEYYEMSSEIAHSSPLLIYSNKQYFFRITLICLYETFLRCENIFITLLGRWGKLPLGFENVRKDRLMELMTILNEERRKFANHY